MTFRPWDNLGLKALALALAVVLWFVVLGEQRAERVVSARVEFRDVPQGLVVVSRSDGPILLKLQGPKRVLADLELDEVIVSLGARARCGSQARGRRCGPWPGPSPCP